MFSVMLSSPSYAKWTKVVADTRGNTFYVDVERIRKVDGYVYYWFLTDYGKRDEYGMFSAKEYHQVDCKLFRFKKLSYVFHKEPMGRDAGDVQEPVKKGWRYPSSRSGNESLLKLVCAPTK